MDKFFQWFLKAKTKIAIWATPIVLLFYFDDKIHFRDRVYYFFIAFFKSIPLLMLYSYFSMWKDKNEFFKAGTFDIKEFLVKNTEMVFIIVAVYISLSLLNIPLDESEMGKIFKSVVQLTTLLYPVSKILKNAFILTNGKFPPQFVMKALYNYEREGKLKDFFDEINGTKTNEPKTEDHEPNTA